MKRRQLLVGTGTVATAALAGCIGSAQTNGDGSARRITVSNTGEAAGDPDLAILQASIEATGETAAAVRDELSERSEQLVAGLVEGGVSEDQITTGQFRIHERLDRRRLAEAEVDPQSDAAEEYRRYEGSHEFRIELTDIESVGGVVDTAVDSGADSIDRIHYTLSDQRQAELREDALDAALNASRTEAEFIAGEVDASVVEVHSVDTSEGRVSPVNREFAAEDAAGSRATDLRPDDVTVRATADVTYRIN